MSADLFADLPTQDPWQHRGGVIDERGSLNRSALVFLFCTLVGCSALQREVRPAPAGLSVSGIAVAPIRWQGAAVAGDRAEALTARLVSRVIAQAQQRLAIVGPEDVLVDRPDDLGWPGGLALPALRESGVNPPGAVRLHATLEQQTNESEAQVADGKGGSRLQRNQVTTWKVVMLLLYPETRTVLLTVSGSCVIDPFAPPGPTSEFDPAPALTALLESTAQAAIDHALTFASQTEKSVVASVVLTPRSLDAPEAPIADALAHEAELLTRARFLTPRLSESEALKVAAQKPGLVVFTSAKGLSAGEVVTHIDGKPATLARFARLPHRVTPVDTSVTSADGRVRQQILPAP